MSMRLSPPLQQTMFWWLKHYLVPVMIACSMIGATFLPWIVDTLGARYSAWKLPVDIDWQFRTAVLNYGLLCVLCAALIFFRIFMHWRLRYDVRTQAGYRIIVVSIGWFCLFPVLLLLFQYLFADVYAINVLAQHEVQMLLIQQHFGYKVLNQLVVLVPFTSTSMIPGATVVSGTTLGGRFVLLIDVLGPGILLPIASGITAFVSCNYHSTPARENILAVPLKQRLREQWYIWLLASLGMFIIFGRAPAAMVCEYQAKQALSIGDYHGAINWLQRAVTLNPALDKIASYHRELGRADYYLQPENLTDNSHLYLASVYSSENDYRDAFSELQVIWDAHPFGEGSPWLTEQLSMTLEWLAEFAATATPTQLQLGPDGLPVDSSTLIQQQTGAGGLPQDVSSSLSNVQQNSNATQQAATSYALAPIVPGNDGSLAALPWLMILSQVDSSNVYARYVLGREFYAQGGYAACIEYMRQVIAANSNADVQSSADTYIALSMIGQGSVAQARQLLLQAVKLDPDFNNNTAREQLSGLH